MQLPDPGPIPVQTSLIIGGIMLLLSLAIALFVKPTPPLAAWIIRVTMALAVGFLGAGILGTLTIEGPVAELVVKAGGPVALTILFYVWTPAPVMIRALQGNVGAGGGAPPP